MEEQRKIVEKELEELREAVTAQQALEEEKKREVEQSKEKL